MGDVPEEMLESKDDNLIVKSRQSHSLFPGRFEVYTHQCRRRSPTSVKDNIVVDTYILYQRE